MLSTPPAFVLSQDQTLVFNPILTVVTGYPVAHSQNSFSELTVVCVSLSVSFSRFRPRRPLPPASRPLPLAQPLLSKCFAQQRLAIISRISQPVNTFFQSFFTFFHSFFQMRTLHIVTLLSFVFIWKSMDSTVNYGSILFVISSLPQEYAGRIKSG